MISAIIPTLNEEKQIGNIIAFLKTNKWISEIIVIDDGSIDRTFQIAKDSGAKVFLSSMLGKGASLADGIGCAKNDLVFFLDGDIFNFKNDLVENMTKPLLENQADFVKGKFLRKAGRVTELTARPLINTFFPELSRFSQPLGGIVAGKKSFLQQIHFEADYGVDVGLLIDIYQMGARVTEVDIGAIDHDHQPLESLSRMSHQIVRTILDRALKYDRLHFSSLKDASERTRVRDLHFDTLLARIDPKRKLVLFDMDGTIIDGRYIDTLAKLTHRWGDLEGLLDNYDLNPADRTRMIAKLFTGVSKNIFEKAARAVSLHTKAQETVVEFRKRGYQVGIITDSYFIASEIIRKRVFADFSVANLLKFNKGTASGEIVLSPLMQIESGCQAHPICKANFVRHLRRNFGKNTPDIMAVGNGENDICLFKESQVSAAVYPESAKVANSANFKISSLNESLAFF